MVKDEVLVILESDINNPGSYKSGEFLEQHVLRHASSIIKTDRVSLIDALKEWIQTKTEPRAMLAVKVAQKLKLEELKPEIVQLRNEVSAGKNFPLFYLRYFDEALKNL